MKSFSEDRRQLEHLAPLFFAFLLRFLSWPVAMVLAVAAIFYGWFISPLWGTSRPGEARVSGKVFYAVTVLILLLVFRQRLEYAAGVWGVLAVGDSLSNMLGRRFGSRRLPWNSSKSWFGSGVFFLSGAATFLILLAWFQGPHVITSRRWILFSLIVGFACALAESLPAFVDDNLFVGFAGAFTVLLLEAMFWSYVTPAYSWLPPLITNGLLAVAVYFLRLVTFSGAAAGFVCGSLVFWGAGWRGFLLLFLFFVWGSASTHVKRQRKEALQIAQPNRGRRSARHALANCLMGSLVALGVAFSLNPVLWKAALLGVFATAAFDTVSTELGQAFGKSPISIRTWRRVAPGTEGAISVEGTLAGLLAAISLVLAAWITGFLPPSLSAVAIPAAVVAVMVESWIGATAAATHPLKNEMLNFYNTALGASVAAGLACWIV